jgi:hypothetical protein
MAMNLDVASTEDPFCLVLGSRRVIFGISHHVEKKGPQAFRSQPFGLTFSDSHYYIRVSKSPMASTTRG